MLWRRPARRRAARSFSATLESLEARRVLSFTATELLSFEVSDLLTSELAPDSVAEATNEAFIAPGLLSSEVSDLLTSTLPLDSDAGSPNDEGALSDAGMEPSAAADEGFDLGHSSAS